jgi:hypothetical protein
MVFKSFRTTVYIFISAIIFSLLYLNMWSMGYEPQKWSLLAAPEMKGFKPNNFIH